MKRIKNILLTDGHRKPIATDLFFVEDGRPKPVLIYLHGFNGFKDWGNFDLVAARFAAAGFAFIKFNGSFNGTTPEQPEAFTDLDAYAENNYTKELDNLDAVIGWACSEDNPFHKEMAPGSIGLIGHSRGGGIVLLKAGEDLRVKAVAAWASVSACKTPWGSWPEDRMRAWKETGVTCITNSRTRQELPLHYQLYEDYCNNRERLDIAQAVKRLQVPLLLCHGSADPAVPVAAAYQLKEWQPRAELFLLDTDHVFGRKHPWTEDGLPQAMEQVLLRTIAFFGSALKRQAGGA